MIITRLSGGMGNQLFQYALGRVLAIKNNTTLGLDMHELLDRTNRPGNFVFRNYDLDLFNIEAVIVSQQEVPFWYRSWKVPGMTFLNPYINKIRRMVIKNDGKERGFGYQPGVLALGPDAYLDGYWQSHKYFESVADTIRKDFTLKQSLPAHIQRVQTEIQSKRSVCVHVRRGDYVGNSFHEVVFKDYYYQALDVLESKTTIDHIYVFSDDIAWCKDNLAFLHPVTFVDDVYAGERASGHFALMGSCTHFVIPNSSFAWWAAWLGEAADKVVIAPKQWFADTSIDTRDRIPEAWIRI